MTATPPTTQAEADAWFRCERLSCSMTGSACAARWALSQSDKVDRWGKVGIDSDNCRGCPLGAARHQLGAHQRAPQFTPAATPRQPAPQADQEGIMYPSAYDHVRAHVEKGQCTAADAAAALDLSLSTVHKHLQTMLTEGLAVRDKGEGYAAYRYSPVFRPGAAATAPPPSPLAPLDPGPPAAPTPAEVVELQPEVSTEAVPEAPECTAAQVQLDRAEDAYVAARDALQAGAELAVQLLDEGDEVKVIAAAVAMRKLATALEDSFRALDEARGAVDAERYDALLVQMGVQMGVAA